MSILICQGCHQNISPSRYLNSRLIFSHSWGWKFKTEVLTGSVSLEAAPLGLQMAPSPCPCCGLFLKACPSFGLCVLITSSYRCNSQVVLGATLKSYSFIFSESSLSRSSLQYSCLRYWGLEHFPSYFSVTKGKDVLIKKI